MNYIELISNYINICEMEFMILMIPYMIFVYIFWYGLLIWIFKTLVIDGIRRKKNRTYFKNNVILNKTNKNQGSNKSKYPDKYEDVSKDKLSRFNTDDINALKDLFYNIFLEFENAYNNLDYNIMKLLSTRELYNNYYTGISLDLKTGKKRIINDIEKKKVIVFELDSTSIKQTARVMIEISYINYMIDKKGKVISGNRHNKITERFEVTFRKEFERKETTKCYNCGAFIEGNKCVYCRTPVRNSEFKISSIKKIIDN